MKTTNINHTTDKEGLKTIISLLSKGSLLIFRRTRSRVSSLIETKKGIFLSKNDRSLLLPDNYRGGI